MRNSIMKVDNFEDVQRCSVGGEGFKLGGAGGTQLLLLLWALGYFVVNYDSVWEFTIFAGQKHFPTCVMSEL